MLKNANGFIAIGVFLCPWMGGIAQRARKAVRVCPWMGGQIFRSCKICTSTIPGGRIAQRARKAIKACLLLLLSLPGYALAADNYFDNSPFDTRDQNLFNLIHGQALPTNAQLIKHADGAFTSTLAITNTLNIEKINSTGFNENIYLDYEAYRFNFSYQHVLNKHWNLKLDIPLVHQSGGIFDSAIDRWHQMWGLPSGYRPLVQDNQYDIRYNFQSQASLNLSESSTSLADIQLAAARSLIEDDSTVMSFWAALKLPTGDEDKLTGNGAVDLSAWLAINQQLSTHWLINANAGLVLLGKDNFQNIPLADQVFYGHIMLAWLLTEDINLKLQLQGHSSYYQQSRLKILGDAFILSFGGAYNVSKCQQLDFAFTEDIKADASPDASLLISWRSLIGNCS